MRRIKHLIWGNKRKAYKKRHTTEKHASSFACFRTQHSSLIRHPSLFPRESCKQLPSITSVYINWVILYHTISFQILNCWNSFPVKCLQVNSPLLRIVFFCTLKYFLCVSLKVLTHVTNKHTYYNVSVKILLYSTPMGIEEIWYVNNRNDKAGILAWFRWLARPITIGRF